MTGTATRRRIKNLAHQVWYLIETKQIELWLELINDEILKDFIRRAIDLDVNTRASVEELLDHEFMKVEDKEYSGGNILKTGNPFKLVHLHKKIQVDYDERIPRVLNIKIVYTRPDDHGVREIFFEYDLKKDTPESVVSEMRENLEMGE